MVDPEPERTATGWWRWPLVPLAAVAGATAGSSLFLALWWLGMKFEGGGEDGWLFLYVRPVVGACVFGWLFSAISWWVAPQGKLITGTVMVTILSLVLLVLSLASWLLAEITVGEAIQTTVWSLGAAAGAVFALLQAHSDPGERVVPPAG